MTRDPVGIWSRHRVLIRQCYKKYGKADYGNYELNNEAIVKCKPVKVHDCNFNP